MAANGKKLTDRQQEILEFIQEFIAEHGSPPTIREIGAQFHIRSPKGVSDHLAALERKGYLKRQSGKSRRLALTERSRPRTGIPVLGHVAAGSPVLAEENVLGVLDSAPMVRPGVFALRVRGESMVNAGILDGDTVIVDRNAQVRSGDVGLVALGGEATVKRVFFEKQSVRLQPENDSMGAKCVGLDDPELQICGRVVGVVRLFD